MKFRRFLVFLSVFGMFISILEPPTTNALQSQQWLYGATGYARGLELQRERSVPRVVYFYNDRCPNCRTLDDLYLTAPRVRRALQRFVAVRINPDYGQEENEIMGRFRVMSYPAFFIMDKESSPPRNVQPFGPNGTRLTPEQFALAIEEGMTFRSMPPKLPREQPVDPSVRDTAIAVGNATHQTHSAKIVAVPGTALSPSETKSNSLSGIDAVLSKYVNAIGGRDAQERLKSRVIKGRIELSGVNSWGQLNVYSQVPNKSLAVMNVKPMGEVKHGFDGCKVWNVGGTNGSQAITDAALSGFSTDTFFYREIRLREVYPGIRLRGTVKEKDREFYMVEALSRFGGTETMYFEVESGLLARRYLTQQTLRGPIPVEMRYSDWREVDGVKLPFKITQSKQNQEFVFIVSEVKHDLPLDDRLF